MPRPTWGAQHPARRGDRVEVLRVGTWMPAERRRGATGLGPLVRQAVLLADPVGVYQHWLSGATPRDGRNMPCIVPSCPHCAAGRPARWWGYVAALTVELPAASPIVQAPAPASAPADPLAIWRALAASQRERLAQELARRRGRRSADYLDAGYQWPITDLHELAAALRRDGLMPTAEPGPQPARPATPPPPKYIVPVVAELTELAGEPLLDLACRGLLIELRRDPRRTALDPIRCRLRMLKGRRSPADLPDAWDPRRSVQRLWGALPDDGAPRWEDWADAGHVREDLAREGWVDGETDGDASWT